MTQPDAASPAAGTPRRLPRRDLLLIPLISLATLAILAAAAELASRHLFAESGGETCSIADPLHGYRIRPNCISTRKAAEGDHVENAYNDCGYRTREPCKERTPAAIRVALLGASTAQGFKMDYERSFAGRASAVLSRACGRTVEFQNMGVAGYKPLNSYWRIDEALAMRPDVVLLVMVPYDLEDVADRDHMAKRREPERIERKAAAAASAPRPNNPLQTAQALVQDSRGVLAAQHFLYQDRAVYVRMFMQHADKADYLRQPMSPLWSQRLADLDVLLGEMQANVARADVPFVLVLGPQRIQVALLEPATRPPGVDPHAIGTRFAAITAKHGIPFRDALADFAKVPHPERTFYAVDGHMTADGHAILADAVTRRLGEANLPAFAGCDLAAIQSSGLHGR